MNYEYLKQWLSQEDMRKIRDGENPIKRKYSRQQIYNIMTGKSKNFPLRNHLVMLAQENEKLSKVS